MFGIDKVYHSLFYGLLAYVLGFIACYFSPKGKSRSRLMGIGAALLWIGVLDEYRQFLDPHRDTEFLDGVANLVGVSLGLALSFITYAKSITPVRIRWAIAIPIGSVWLLLFFGLQILTSKGPSGDFFPEGSPKEGVRSISQSQVVIQMNQEQRGVALLREKYLSQLLYVEQEHQQELESLISYMFSGHEVFRHLWLMKQLNDATNDQLEHILQDMKKTVQLERLPEELLGQVEKECMERKRIARANMLKQAIIHWRQQSYG